MANLDRNNKVRVGNKRGQGVGGYANSLDKKDSQPDEIEIDLTLRTFTSLKGEVKTSELKQSHGSMSFSGGLVIGALVIISIVGYGLTPQELQGWLAVLKVKPEFFVAPVAFGVATLYIWKKRSARNYNQRSDRGISLRWRIGKR